MGKSLYIHIPFCKKKCSYCDFYSAIYDKNLAKSYVEVILKQIEALDGNFFSVYIGGGTPTVLSLGLLDKLLSGLSMYIKYNIEFTVEANPESVDIEKLRLFIDKGVNRISIGCQSFDDRKLKTLGRIHGARQGIEAIELSKKAGFKNISIDLIYGAPGEDLELWQAELQKAAGFNCQHVSCYSLSYEKDTPCYKMREKKEIIVLEEDMVSDMFKYTMSYLASKGFCHYEVSNFAMPGFECRHNLNYWDNNSYVGIGPSAVSYMEGARSENVRDLRRYIDKYEKGESVIENRENLSGIKMARETAAVRIRTHQGLDYKWFKDKTGFEIEDITEKSCMEELFKDNLLEYKTGKTAGERLGIRLSERGFLFSDTVSAAFL